MKRTLCMTLLALMTTTAMAESITVQSTGTAPFAGFSVGTTATVGYLNSTAISAPDFGITFSGAGTGVYSGSELNVAASPFTLGTFSAASCTSCAEYFSVEPGGSITITFNAPQTSLDILWGTVASRAGLQSCDYKHRTNNRRRYNQFIAGQPHKRVDQRKRLRLRALNRLPL